jgi:hypothetical protein
MANTHSGKINFFYFFLANEIKSGIACFFTEFGKKPLKKRANSLKTANSYPFRAFLPNVKPKTSSGSSSPKTKPS